MVPASVSRFVGTDMSVLYNAEARDVKFNLGSFITDNGVKSWDVGFVADVR